NLGDALKLLSYKTVAQMLERDDFSKRYKGGVEIYLSEFMYPLLQGYDSVMLHSDVEIGGTDQTFNVLVGRELQPIFGQPPQQIMTMQLIVGLDGYKKMGKSEQLHRHDRACQRYVRKTHVVARSRHDELL